MTWILASPAPRTSSSNSLPLEYATRSSTADQQYVVKLEDPEAPNDVTAIVGCAVMTSCGAVINAAQVRPGQSVAVIGAGGVGLCVIQAAYNMGAHPLIVVDLNDEKIEFAKHFGASICEVLAHGEISGRTIVEF